MEWTLTNIILSTIIVSLGALLQAASGLGAGIIIVPLLAVLSFELIPGPVIFASLILTVMMAYRGRMNIDYSGVSILLLGLLLGTLVAAYYIATLPMQSLGFSFGIFILLAVAASVMSPKFSFSHKTYFSAGTLSGFMGTSAGVGAPVLALLYQHQDGSTIRATLAFLYFISSIIMLLVLNFTGRFGVDELISGIYLIPGFIFGYLFSPTLVSYIDKGYARTAVLMISTFSACALIWKSIAMDSA